MPRKQDLYSNGGLQLTPNLGGVSRSIGVERAGGVVEGSEFLSATGGIRRRRRHTYRTGSGSVQNCEINKESRQNKGRKSRRRNRIAVGAGKRQALKHGNSMFSRDQDFAVMMSLRARLSQSAGSIIRSRSA